MPCPASREQIYQSKDTEPGTLLPVLLFPPPLKQGACPAGSLVFSVNGFQVWPFSKSIIRQEYLNGGAKAQACDLDARERGK